MPGRSPGPKVTVERVRFVGRLSELAELEAQLQLASRRGFRCVLLTGDPGVGKTRLSGELLARNRGGVVALSARAHRLGGTAAYDLWDEALERHLRRIRPAEISRLC